MPKEEKANPTPSELEILQFLWKNGPSTVKQIHEELEKSKVVVYTTTLKTMQVMYERGMLKREAQGRKDYSLTEINLSNFLSRLLKFCTQLSFSQSFSKIFRSQNSIHLFFLRLFHFQPLYL